MQINRKYSLLGLLIFFTQRRRGVADCISADEICNSPKSSPIGCITYWSSREYATRHALIAVFSASRRCVTQQTHPMWIASPTLWSFATRSP